jgi:hypothetical protein
MNRSCHIIAHPSLDHVSSFNETPILISRDDSTAIAGICDDERNAP